MTHVPFQQYFLILEWLLRLDLGIGKMIKYILRKISILTLRIKRHKVWQSKNFKSHSKNYLKIFKILKVYWQLIFCLQFMTFWFNNLFKSKNHILSRFKRFLNNIFQTISKEVLIYYFKFFPVPQNTVLFCINIFI